MLKNQPHYVWDEHFVQECNRLPAVPGRASMVHELIAAYGLLEHMKVIRPVPASYTDLRQFHSELYLDHLKSFIEVDEEYMSSSRDEEYGFGYDCPPVSNMYELVCAVAGGSITAAKCLLLGAQLAINWGGGWHHAQRFSADGFCYVNDIVLAIEVLKKKFQKILYIDLDVHHGNGVQDAYNLSKSVFTLSFHKFEPGFYPGTGGIDDVGSLNGLGYSCNVPLHAWYSDTTLQYVFERIFMLVCSHFAPEAIVIQCGADALAHDPHGGASLTVKGYCACIQTVLDKQLPTLLLGGGGYKHCNAARLWTSITALITRQTLDENIPEHSHWPSYGPSYTISTDTTLIRDTNKKSYLDECVTVVEGNLNKYLARLTTLKDQNENECRRKKTEIIKEEDNEVRDTVNNSDGNAIIGHSTRRLWSSKQNTFSETNIADVYAFTED